jgi:FkbM family methyltransferase
VVYYGQDELDKIIYENFFKDKKNGFFVECGAFDGLAECTCKFFEDSVGWKGINIEPLPYAFNLLVKNRPNSININCALSDKNIKRTFTQAVHPKYGMYFGNGSLKHTKDHLIELRDTHCKFRQYKVQCKKFDSICKEYKISEIDLFVLDVEGHEIEALKGIISLDYKVLPKVFCIEHTLCGGHKVLNSMLKDLYIMHSIYKQNVFFIKRPKAED